MYFANIGQIPKKDSSDVPFDAWVVFVYLDKGDPYPTIHNANADVFAALNAKRVNYSEIITGAGGQKVLELFGCKARRLPLFLVCDKHPSEYEEGDVFLVIEWGRWEKTKALSNDLSLFANFFEDVDFPTLLENARTGSADTQLTQFVADHSFDEMQVGVNLSLNKYPAPPPRPAGNTGPTEP